MAKYVQSLDLNKNELLNAIIQNLAASPNNPTAGQIYYNTAEKRLKWHDGTKWINADAKDAELTGQQIVDAINESTQLISRDRIQGLQEMFDDAAMAGKDIIEAINSDESISISMNKIAGLQAALDDKEKVGVAQNRANTALQSAKEYADGVIVDAMNSLIGGAGEAYDTLGELQAFIETHGGQIDELINATHKHVVNIGDGVATEHTITHNLNTSGVIVQIRETIAPYAQVIADVEIIDENSILIRTSRPITSEEKLNVTVIG